MLSIFFIFLVNTSFSIKLKAIIVIYENENEKKATFGRDYDFFYINSFLNTLDKNNIVDVEKIIIGKDFNKSTKDKITTKKEIINTIKNIKVEENDVLFFCYSGHGFIFNKKRYIATERDILDRKRIEDEIAKKSSRLKILITEACSNYLKVAINFDVDVNVNDNTDHAFKITSKHIKAYKSLFHNYKGFVNFTSSEKGKSSLRTKKGSLFIKSLFIESLLKNPSNTWKSVFNHTKQYLKKIKENQNPISFSFPNYRIPTRCFALLR